MRIKQDNTIQAQNRDNIRQDNDEKPELVLLLLMLPHHIVALAFEMTAKHDLL
jgi:hypothetical protein